MEVGGQRRQMTPYPLYRKFELGGGHKVCPHGYLKSHPPPTLIRSLDRPGRIVSNMYGAWDKFASIGSYFQANGPVGHISWRCFIQDTGRVEWKSRWYKR
jgi:hypothetical protein